jgi:hypothetical protein
VRIRRRTEKRRYPSGKSVYKTKQILLTIPAKFRNIVEPFLDKDLKVEVRREGDSLIFNAERFDKEFETCCLRKLF